MPRTSHIAHRTSQKALLLEWSPSHSEFLHAQIRFLNYLGVEVHLWLNRASPFRLQADERVAGVTYIDGGGLAARVRTGLALRRYLTLHGIDRMLLNTAHGLFARDLALLLLGHPVRVTGICHFAEKLGKTFTQNTITRKVRRYFVLHPYMERWAVHPPGVRLDHFYYVFFVPPGQTGAPVLPGAGEEIRLVVPGALEPPRRDYDSLLTLARQGRIPPNVKLVLLGNAAGTEYGLHLLAALKAEGLEQHFVTFDGFVPDEVFYDELRRCAGVLSLLHPSCRLWEVFTRYSISGTYNLAFAFQKPLLCIREPFAGYEVFKDVGLFYEDGELGEMLQSLAERPEQIATAQAGYANVPELGFEHQARHYGRFLLD